MQMSPDWQGFLRISKNRNAQCGALNTGTLMHTPRVSLHECNLPEKPFGNVYQET